MLFFIFYTQNQQQSRAKTKKNRPQTRRNPPLFHIFTHRIGRKSQFFTPQNTHISPPKHAKISNIYKFNIISNYKLLYIIR